MNSAFWSSLDELVAKSKIVIDRPKGTSHPRFPGLIYPLDYGYLDNTSSNDGASLDLYLGTVPQKELPAVIITTDLYKRDVEVKLIISCSASEIKIAYEHSNTGYMHALLVLRNDNPEL